MALRPAWLAVSFALVAGVAVACTHTVSKEVDDPAGDDDDDAGSSGLAALQFRPAQMYSGVDGTHAFKVPFAIYNAGDDVEVTASPASAVKITPKALAAAEGDKGKYYFAETKAAGDVTLTVKSNGKTASGTLHIEQYAAARWSAGEQRYINAVDDAHPACSKCHGEGGIDHSPSALASVTDEKIGLIMSTGLSTGNFPISVDKTQYPDGHKWTSGPGPEQDGLITYLRALEPKGFK